MKIKKLFLILLLPATLTPFSYYFSSNAFAAGFQINEISTSLQGNAFAGAAAANNDVSALFINPATLSTLQESQILLGMSKIMPKIRLLDSYAIHTVNVPGDPPSPIGAPVSGQSTQPNLAKSALIPNGYFGWRINSKLSAGLAIVSPYGLKTEYNNNSVLRFASQYNSIRTINIMPALSYKINDQWSVGAGIQAQHLKAALSNYNGLYTGDSEDDAYFAANYPTYLKGSAWGYGYTVGVLYQPTSRTRLGLGYRSQITEKLQGYGQQYTFPGPTVAAPSQDFLFNAETFVSTTIRTPAVLTFSAAQDYANWTFKATAQLNFWNSLNELMITMPQAYATSFILPLKWKNSWLTAIGADYRVTPALTFRTGIAYDQTPTTGEYRNARVPDNDRVWLSLGTTYQINPHFSIDAAYSHLFIENQNIDNTQMGGTNALTTEPLEINQVRARFSASANIVSLALRYRF